jgi:acetaldehyde dehydrogenase/alcohol dehydrogenase
VGIIAGIVPTTNPTSTVIFKCLLALKTRCALLGWLRAAWCGSGRHARRLPAPHTRSLPRPPCPAPAHTHTHRRNAIVLSPHVRAAGCSIAAARIVREAAERAGAPKGLIAWIDKPSLVLATALMKDPKVNLILATGVLLRCESCVRACVHGVVCEGPQGCKLACMCC